MESLDEAPIFALSGFVKPIQLPDLGIANMSALWGEIPVVPDTDSGIAAIEREQLTKLRPMEVEGPRLHQPSSRHYPPTNEPLPPESFQTDPLTLHTIRLIQHSKKLRSLIASVQQQQQETQAGVDADVTFPVTPPIPEYTGPPRRSKTLGPVPFTPIDRSSDFARAKGKPPPVIDDVACRKLLRRSVAAICAHTGYDSCAESILETMTDIAHEFYLQFTRHLRTAADHAMQTGESGFPDIIQQVYHEMGIGSVTCLHDFYQYKVVNYHRIMEEQCQQLAAEYDKLKEKPIIKTQDTLSVIRIKEEPHSEINFPVLDDNDEVIEAEQLLNLEGLVGFEITVEHESATGLTTEVESKWSQSIKTEPVDKVNSLDSFDEPSSIQRDVPASQTPATQSSETEENMTDPGSIPVSDIMSPPSITSRPSKPKKKKKS